MVIAFGWGQKATKEKDMRSETRLKVVTICSVIVLLSIGHARAGWTILDKPEAIGTHLTGIDGNNLVGYYYLGSYTHGFLYNGTTWTTLDYPGAPDTIIYGISGNNLVGYYYDASGGHGFLYNGTTWTTIDYPGATVTIIHGISGSNLVGEYPGGHGFLYNGTIWTTIDYPGAMSTYTYGIDGNNLVGLYCDANYYHHGFLYNGTTWTTIDYPGATDTDLSGISGSNIVGGFYDASENVHGFIYTQPPVCSEQIPGDLNGDCIVDFEDFAIMASHWLQRSSVIIANFNLDTNPNWTTQGQWQFGTPMGMGGISYGYPDPDAAYTGQNVYGVNLNGDYTVTVGGPYTLTTGPFDCNSYATVELSFARWLNTDTADYVQCKVEASNDGSAWQTVWLNPDTEPITDNQWQVVEYDISQIAAGHSHVYVRWSYQILSRAYPYSGWNIDDVKLQGLTN